MARYLSYTKANNLTYSFLSVIHNALILPNTYFLNSNVPFTTYNRRFLSNIGIMHN